MGEHMVYCKMFHFLAQKASLYFESPVSVKWHNCLLFFFGGVFTKTRGSDKSLDIDNHRQMIFTWLNIILDGDETLFSNKGNDYGNFMTGWICIAL